MLIKLTPVVMVAVAAVGFLLSMSWWGIAAVGFVAGALMVAGDSALAHRRKQRHPRDA